MNKSQPNKTKIKKDGTSDTKECLHGIVKEAPLKGILSRRKKKSEIKKKKKKKKVSFNEIPDVRVFVSDISDSDSYGTASPASTSSSSASPARGNIARGNPVRLPPVRVSPTRAKASHDRARVSPTRAKSSHDRARVSPTRAKSNHARARSNTTIVSPASIIPASDEPSELVITPFSYRFPPSPEVTPEDTDETKLFMANLLRELDKNVRTKRGNFEYMERNEIDLANPSRCRPLPNNVGSGEPPPKKARTLIDHGSNNDEMATPFDSMIAMMPHFRIVKRYLD